MESSSRGPVYGEGANIRTTRPDREKPDLAAVSGAATYTEWDDCKPRCGANLYFGGTSAATGHVGGLAALVVEWHKKARLSYEADDITDFLRESARPQRPDDGWGHGLVKLACPPLKVSIPQTRVGSWAVTDCVSVRRAGRYEDAYTFRVTARATLQIDLTSTTTLDPYLYLYEGAVAYGTDYKVLNDNGGTGNGARIRRSFTPGLYTILATTARGVKTGGYNLSISVVTTR